MKYEHALQFMERMAESVPVCEEGYTYMVKCSISNEIKIGMTDKSLMKRMANYRTHLPGDLCILAFDIGSEKEAQLHNIFKKQRAHGEWFKLDIEEIVAACGILTINVFNAEERAAKASAYFDSLMSQHKRSA